MPAHKVTASHSQRHVMCRPQEQGIVPTNVRPDAAHAQLQSRPLVREKRQ
jgi:hypothetical protein